MTNKTVINKDTVKKIENINFVKIYAWLQKKLKECVATCSHLKYEVPLRDCEKKCM